MFNKTYVQDAARGLALCPVLEFGVLAFDACLTVTVVVKRTIENGIYDETQSNKVHLNQSLIQQAHAS